MSSWASGLPPKQLQAASKPIMNQGISQLASAPSQQAEANRGEKRRSAILSHSVSKVSTGTVLYWLLKISVPDPVGSVIIWLHGSGSVIEWFPGSGFEIFNYGSLLSNFELKQ